MPVLPLLSYHREMMLLERLPVLYHLWLTRVQHATVILFWPLPVHLGSLESLHPPGASTVDLKLLAYERKLPLFAR